MVWNIFDAKWEKAYALAAAYYEENGNLNIPRSYVTATGERLGQWVASQQWAYPKGKLTDEQVERLNRIGMYWGNRNDRQWNEGYQEAKRYFDAHGDLNVPADYVSPNGYNLGNWVKRQRYTRHNPEKSCAVLTEERIAKLDTIGMRWEKADSRPRQLELAQEPHMFADFFKPIARYNSERGIWYVYDGTVWQPDTENLKVAELAKLLADKLYVFALTITEEDARKRFIDRVRKLQLRKHRETMLKDAKSVFPLSMRSFDQDIYLFNCKNGTLDLRTMEFREHRPEDYLTKVSPVNYDPKADCPRWHTFMDEIMQGDKARADYLQKAIGYALTGDTKMECLFILYGPTSRNGKGTTMESILRIMGEYGKNADPTMLQAKFNAQSNGPTEEIARLAGARFVNISEPAKKLTIDAALTKRLTGNDTITARYLHENSFEFRPNFKIFINTNHRPNITDLTLFDSGRIKIIPFDRHFDEKEQDKDLKTTFAKPENMSGILNWMLEGYKMFRSQGLEMPDSVINATDDYRKASDKIAQFCEACLVSKPGAMLRSKSVYNRYKQWSEANGYHAEGIKNFKTEFLKHYVEDRRRPLDGGEKTTVVLDVDFLVDDDDPPPELVPV